MIQQNNLSFFLVGSIDEFFFDNSKKKYSKVNIKNNFKKKAKKNFLPISSVIFVPVFEFSFKHNQSIYTQTEALFFNFQKKLSKVNSVSFYRFFQKIVGFSKINLIIGSLYKNFSVTSYNYTLVQCLVFSIVYGSIFSVVKKRQMFFNYMFYSFIVNQINSFSFSKEVAFNNHGFVNQLNDFNGLRDFFYYFRSHNLNYYNGFLVAQRLFFFNKIVSFSQKKISVKPKIKGFFKVNQRFTNKKNNYVLVPTTFKRKWLRLSSFFQQVKGSNLGFFLSKSIIFQKKGVNKFMLPLSANTRQYVKSQDKKVQTKLKVKGKKSVKKDFSVNYLCLDIKKTNAVVPQTVSTQLLFSETDSINQAVSDFNQFKVLLSAVSGIRFSIYHVNALSLARFIFDEERRISSPKTQTKDTSNNIRGKGVSNVKTSGLFLSSLVHERQSRYRNVAVYVQDLIRISFFSIYLKKASFLAAFFAFTLSKLPRNRKETKFLHFLIKLIKVFASQRKEIIGMRIRFQGRVNRWRRTKHILGENGIIAFYSYNSRIDYGMAQAITRKGSQGIRFWISYQSYFVYNLRRSIFHYLTLPKKLFLPSQSQAHKKAKFSKNTSKLRKKSFL